MSLCSALHIGSNEKGPRLIETESVNAVDLSQLEWERTFGGILPLHFRVVDYLRHRRGLGLTLVIAL